MALASGSCFCASSVSSRSVASDGARYRALTTSAHSRSSWLGEKSTTVAMKSPRRVSFRTSSQVTLFWVVVGGGSVPKRISTASRVRRTAMGGFRSARTSSSCRFVMPRTADRAASRAGSALASSASASRFDVAMVASSSARVFFRASPSRCFASASFWSATMRSRRSLAMASCSSRRAFCNPSSSCIVATLARARASSRKPASFRRWDRSSARRFASLVATHRCASSTKSRAVASNASAANECSRTRAATTARRIP
mmetsp:Transcript_20988/g.67616  ORF Transcript_20988/g.67616 Transcript_20988/m.67616 type:complete len:257 (+) Transcript_20988:2252-3022(+)